MRAWPIISARTRSYLTGGSGAAVVQHMMIKMLNACIKDGNSHLAVFLMHQDGSARLDFIQNMEYKFVELLSCHFIPSPEDVIRRQVHTRAKPKNLAHKLGSPF